MTQQKKQTQLPRPWYREPWWWFLFGPLMFVVGASLVTVFIAFKTTDDVVSDDYQKVGKGYEKDFSVEAKTQLLDLNGEVEFDFAAQQVRVFIIGDRLTIDTPDSVTISLLHPQHEERDRDYLLVPKGRMLAADISNLLNQGTPPTGFWNVRLQAQDTQGQTLWRLEGRINFDSQHSLSL